MTVVDNSEAVVDPRIAAMTPDDVYETVTGFAWKFDYDFPEEKIEDLYNRAKSNQWDAAVEMPWDTEVDPSKPLIESDWRMPKL